jgi:hypothetical protein
MAGLGETVRSFFMRERLVGRFDQKTSAVGVSVFDVFLKEGVEYVVRGRVSGGRAFAGISLTGPDGAMVPVGTEKRRMHFSVVPEKAGFYQIRVLVDGVADKAMPATVSVSLGSACTPPPYIMRQSVIPAYLAAQPELAHRLSEGVAGEADLVVA